jgi:signal transduction histidine kinase
MRDELAGFVRRHRDEAMAGAITAFALAEIVRLNESVGIRVAAAAGVAVLGTVAARRKRVPILFLALLVVVTIEEATMPELVATGEAIGLFLLLALYNAAAHTSGRRTLIAGGLVLVLFITNLAIDYFDGLGAEDVVFYALILGAPWSVGRAVRGWRLSDSRLKQQEARAETAIVEERARIARELHDVIAHSISVIVLQARGGRRVLEADPAEAHEAFATIEHTGHQALEEMRRLLGMLRTSADAPALAPQPSLKELDRLVEQVQAAGLPVDVAIEGEVRKLPASVDVSAYRIVQEALTNVLKHAGPTRARVTLRYGANDLELEIGDDGPGTADGNGPGFGLIGMRERVSIYGGDLHTERRAQGGFTLRVRLPLASTPL